MSEETTKKVEELSINEQAAAPGEGPVVLGYVNVVCNVDRSNWWFSEDGKPLSKKALKKLEAARLKQQKKDETAKRLAAEKAAREASEVVSIIHYCFGIVLTLV